MNSHPTKPMDRAAFLAKVAALALDYADQVEEHEDDPWTCDPAERMTDFALYFDAVREEA